MTGADDRRHLGDHGLGQAAEVVGALQRRTDIRHVRLDPVLFVGLAIDLLQHPEGTSHDADLVRVVGMRNWLIDLAGSKGFDRCAHVLVGSQNAGTDQNAQQNRQHKPKDE